MIRALAASLAALALATAPALPAAAAAAPAAPEAQPGECPEVAVVAARGSEQNGPDDVIPTRYAPDSPWRTDGYEAGNIRGLLHLAQQRHLVATGQSLLTDVPVITLDPAVFPAELPLPAVAQPDEEISGSEAARRLVGIVAATPPHEILLHAARSTRASMETGIDRTPGHLRAWEGRTGCRPDYILVGYSQGAVVLTAQERWLADAGRLRGVVYLGNPLLGAGDPSTISPAGGSSGGVLRGVDKQELSPVPGVPRVNYCLRDDFVCDARPESAELAIRTGLGVHTLYFHNDGQTGVGVGRETSATDEIVADSLAAMITASV